MGKRILAVPYAKAAFSYALANNALPAWTLFLSQGAVLIADESVQVYLSSVQVSVNVLWQLVESVFSEPLSSEQKNFFQILAEAHRLALWPEIASEFDELCRETESAVMATVTSARPLTAAQKQQLVDALSTNASKAVQLECTEDPTCVAGVRVQVGDWVFDNTVQSQFDRLKNALREAHV